MEYVLVNWHMNWIRLGDWNGKFLFDVHWIRLLHHKRYLNRHDVRYSDTWYSYRDLTFYNGSLITARWFDVSTYVLLHDNGLWLFDRDFDVFYDFNRIRVWNFDGNVLRLGNWNFYLLRDFDWHRMRDWNCCNCTTSKYHYAFEASSLFSFSLSCISIYHISCKLEFLLASSFLRRWRFRDLHRGSQRQSQLSPRNQAKRSINIRLIILNYITTYHSCSPFNGQSKPSDTWSNYRLNFLLSEAYNLHFRLI